MTKPTTILCIRDDFEKLIPRLTSLLHQVRKDKCLRSIRGGVMKYFNWCSLRDRKMALPKNHHIPKNIVKQT